MAVREAFINTLVHADYSAEGSLIITHKRDSFTFSNPGNMLISIAQYYEGGESVCRNRALQTMFMLIGSAEKAGSGVDKILAGWKEENWQRPYVAEKQRPDKVVLLLPMESLLPQANIDGLKKIYGENVEHIGYNKLVTLSICYTEKVVSNDRLKVLLPIHSSEITKMLKDLCNDGFLLSEGNGRGTTYTLKSLSKVDTSAGKVDTSAGKVDTSAAKVDIPIKSRTHLKREELERLIICCSQDYTTLEDIAYKVNRDIKYLQNKVIPRMIQNHKIERLYPATPNHPNQKYKAKDKQ
ncbi:MAG: ATP-binding protein [Prevotella sp.]